MANSFIKAEKVVATALGILEREVVLPGMVWREAGGSFVGAKDDTISIRVPAFTTARTRVMRSGTAITIDDLDETKVDLTLDTHVYKAIGVTDEELTLDITDFGAQVLQPAMSSIVRKLEDELAAEMENATYAVTKTIDDDDPYLGLIDARIALNNANVPAGDRFLAVGSTVEAFILKSDRLARFDYSGSSVALREAIIGRLAGFTVVSVPGLDPAIAIAGHRTAFAMSMQVPAIPAGVAWGATQTYNGFGLRALRDYDNALIKDRLLTDVFVGTGTVKDRGTFDSDGKWQHSEDGTATGKLVRAVKLTMVS